MPNSGAARAGFLGADAGHLWESIQQILALKAAAPLPSRAFDGGTTGFAVRIPSRRHPSLYLFGRLPLVEWVRYIAQGITLLS